MRCYVDGNLLADVSRTMLSGRDLANVHCVGLADKEAGTPLRGDHIFRAFSNTKLVTTCAALLLMEEGRFQLGGQTRMGWHRWHALVEFAAPQHRGRGNEAAPVRLLAPPLV